MWLKKLQLAIIEQNPKGIDALVKEMPEFENVDEMKRASALISEALKLLHRLKNETGTSLKQLKKHKDFLESTMQSQTNRLDITS